MEITSLLEMYLEDELLNVTRMGRGYAWLDTGTHGSLLDAGNFVRTLEERQGLQTGCPEEIAYQRGWISAEALAERARLFSKNGYGVCPTSPDEQSGTHAGAGASNGSGLGPVPVLVAMALTLVLARQRP